MRLWISATILALAVATAVHGQGPPSAADSSAILGAVANWEHAWTSLDPELAARDYAEDADWTNAFGMRRRGRDSVQALLGRVFRLPFVTAGSTDYEYHDLRLVAPNVALLRSRAIRAGQQLPDGTVDAPRHINHLRVFVKRNGKWVIASHLIGDERTPGDPR